MNDRSDHAATAAIYEAPTIVRLGTVEQLTLSGNMGKKDEVVTMNVSIGI